MRAGAAAPAPSLGVSMKIKLTTSMVGSGFTLNKGEETDVFSDADAVRLIEAGFAVPVIEAKIERAVSPAPAIETRTPRKKGVKA